MKRKKLCELCRKEVARVRCRRCGLWVCSSCYFTHGLCRKCAEELQRNRH